MGFEKGNTYGSNGGRPKGTKEDFKKKLRKILDDNHEKFIEELNGLKGRSYVEFHMKLMEFVIPKMKAVETKTTEETKDLSEIAKAIRELNGHNATT